MIIAHSFLAHAFGQVAVAVPRKHLSATISHAYTPGERMEGGVAGTKQQPRLAVRDVAGTANRKAGHAGGR